MKHLAVVNDDDTFISLVSELLQERGWDCLELHEGNAAFETIKREQPDAVILDIRMERPDSGWRVLNLLMLDPGTRSIPVILCPADWAELQAKEEWLNERGVGILPRPFDLDDLYRAVDGAMEQDFPHLVPNEREA